MRARRIAAAAVLLAAVAAGLVVHLALPDSAATDIAGDALYAIAAYAVTVLVAPRLGPPATGAITAVWCVGIELLQLTDLPHAVAAVFPSAVLVLGTVFDARDLGIYAVTAMVATAADVVVRRVTRSEPESPVASARIE